MRTASIVICTHNRAEIVETAVEGALAEARRHDAEVICVDNASTDGTGAVLAALVARHRATLRHVREEVLGLSAARNRGLCEARGEVAAYLDDDAVPRPGWLAALLAPYDHTGVACVGGPLVLRLGVPCPPWFTTAFHPAAGAFDLGDRARRVRGRPGDGFPCGANISFRVADAVRHGGFSPLVGPVGPRHLLHDETDLCARLDRRGLEVRYAPGAVVDHWVVPTKLTPGYFVERQFQMGQSAAVYALRNRGLLRTLSGARWYARYLLARRYVPGDAVDPARLLAECQRREALGYLLGLARGIARLRVLRRDLPLRARAAHAGAAHEATG